MYEPGWKSNALLGKPSRLTTSLTRSLSTTSQDVSDDFLASFVYQRTPMSSQKNANVGTIHITARNPLWKMRNFAHEHEVEVEPVEHLEVFRRQYGSERKNCQKRRRAGATSAAFRLNVIGAAGEHEQDVRDHEHVEQPSDLLVLLDASVERDAIRRCARASGSPGTDTEPPSARPFPAARVLLPKYVYPVFSDTSSVNDVYRSMNATASQAHTAPHTPAVRHREQLVQGAEHAEVPLENGDVDGGATFLYTSAEAHPPAARLVSCAQAQEHDRTR